MSKKLLSLFTLVSFITFTLSCAIHTTKKERVDRVASWEGKKVQILGVLTTSGEKFEFPKKNPAGIYKDKIVHETIKGETIVLDREDIEKTAYDETGDINQITTKDGKTYAVATAKREKDKVIIETYGTISLSEVELLWVRKVDPVSSFLASVGAAAAVLGGIMVIAILTKESCPFIYSFDGERFAFDAEPYGGATCQGLKRTEWCGLEHIREVNGLYKIMITNEVDETQYTDEIKLVVVDHSKEVKVVPDEFGKIHTISQPYVPIQAFDHKGRNLMSYVSENDWIFWQSRTEEKSPDRNEDLKEELLFEFPKPEGAKKAMLLFNGCNTLWASQMVKRFLGLYGNEVYEWYREVNNYGPAYHRMMEWNLNEELYRLQIRVETEEGWKPKGTILGGGPFISEDKIYTLDLSDVPDDILRIKLTPPTAFWMINFLAVDYTEDLPVKVTEIDAIKAVDYKGQDVSKLLAQKDNHYFVLPNIGDGAELIFESPAQIKDMKRSVFLKASGYYDIHLEAKGKPQKEILSKFLIEPGFAIQYALREYLHWKKEIAQKSRIND